MAKTSKNLKHDANEQELAAARDRRALLDRQLAEALNEWYDASRRLPLAPHLMRVIVDEVVRLDRLVTEEEEAYPTQKTLQEMFDEGYSPSGLESEESNFSRSLDAIEQSIQKPELRKVFETHTLFQKYLSWRVQILPDFPAERFGDAPNEDILDFIDRVWKHPYLYCGFVQPEEIKKVDPKAYRAIPWPKARYKADGNMVEFVRVHWKRLIDVGLATRKVIDAYDPVLGIAIANAVKGTRTFDGAPPTLKTLNTRALDSTMIPRRHAARIAGIRSSRLRSPIKPT
jgi:hypothetical protein